MGIDMKELKTYHEQLAILRERGCLIKDDTEAIRVLMRIGIIVFQGIFLLISTTTVLSSAQRME